MCAVSVHASASSSTNACLCVSCVSNVSVGSINFCSSYAKCVDVCVYLRVCVCVCVQMCVGGVFVGRMGSPVARVMFGGKRRRINSRPQAAMQAWRPGPGRPPPGQGMDRIPRSLAFSLPPVVMSYVYTRRSAASAASCRTAGEMALRAGPRPPCPSHGVGGPLHTCTGQRSTFSPPRWKAWK